MPTVIKAFGTSVTECHNREIAIGGGPAYKGRHLRVPLPVLRTLEKLADGPAALTAQEVANLATINVGLIDAQAEVMAPRAKAALATGTGVEAVRTMLADEPNRYYRTDAPLGRFTYYTPFRSGAGNY